MDADGDGQCDNLGLALGYGRGAQDAPCRQAAGTGMRGANFVDENGNGMCDWLEQ